MKYALLSVFDKTGIVEFAKTLSELGYSIISTGGTAKALNQAGITVIPIQEITGNTESFDGRMKTISFEVESGILYDRKNPTHVKQAEELGIKPIDIVVCNLYPFEQKQKIENIDVGGPTMIRAAAKNFQNVLVVVDPNDYQTLTPLLHNNKVDEIIRKKLAAKALHHISIYDAVIAQYLDNELFPDEITLPGRKKMDLRYGENPHQEAALYLQPNTNSIFKNIQKLAGRSLSLTNVSDINAGFESVRLFDKPAAVIIKHNSPCGIALGDTIDQALQRAIESDPESAFGGVIVLNSPVDTRIAHIISSFKDERKGNIDILAAPAIESNALGLLKQVRKSMGIYTFGTINNEPSTMNLKWVDGGFMLQTADSNIEKGFEKWEIVTVKKPSEKQLEQMQLAWRFISRIRSNAVIVVDKDLSMTRGIGSGQTSRVRSTKIALEQAGEHVKGAILASDSFFPFPDSVELAAKYGIEVIVQQGESINDKASIETANKAEITMVFTHRRAFWH